MARRTPAPRTREEHSRHIEGLHREADAVRHDDTLSKQLAAMTVEGLKGLLADHSPEKALEILVDRVVLERDLTCKIELKAVPGRHNRCGVPTGTPS